MPVHHVATVTKVSQLPEMPYKAACSCGTQGTFFEKSQAMLYMEGHGHNVRANNVLNTFELVDKAVDAEVDEKTPTPPESRKGVNLKGEQDPSSAHVGGVGEMPVSHVGLKNAAHPGPPPAPPAPPNKGEKKSESDSKSAVK